MIPILYRKINVICKNLFLQSTSIAKFERSPNYINIKKFMVFTYSLVSSKAETSENSEGLRPGRGRGGGLMLSSWQAAAPS
jgi:hypothetical protein